MTRFATNDLAILLGEHMRYRSIERVVASSNNPDALKRRIHDILHHRSETVTLRVTDEIATTCGHEEWLQIMEPV